MKLYMSDGLLTEEGKAYFRKVVMGIVEEKSIPEVSVPVAKKRIRVRFECLCCDFKSGMRTAFYAHSNRLRDHVSLSFYAVE